MAKQPNLSDITNLLNSQAILNANWDAIQAAFQNTVSRDGSTPNQMEADLDLNSNDLLNVGLLQADNIEVSGLDLGAVSSNAAAAAASATEAAQSAEDAETFATSALISKGAAEDARDDILGLTATATTLSAGSAATASYNSGTGVMSFGIPTGPTGATGADGPQGPAGTGINPQGSVSTSTSLPGYPASYVGDYGDAYITEDTGNMWVWTEDDVWTDFGSLQGPAGPTGPQGATGPQGPQGIQGPAGDAFIFDNVSDMVAATSLTVGDFVRTKGYSTPGDGGGADYKIVAAATGTDDGGSYHDLSGISGQAQLQYNTIIKAEWWGVAQDTESSAEWNAAFAFAADLSRSSRADNDATMTFICNVDFTAKDVLQMTKSGGGTCEVIVWHPGKITAIGGGEFAAVYSGTFLSSGVPVAETAPIPLINCRVQRADIMMGALDCNFWCSGVRFHGTTSTRFLIRELYHFRKYGMLVLDRGNNAIQIYDADVKQWQISSDDNHDFSGRMGANGNQNWDNYTGDPLVCMQKDFQVRGGTFGWARSAIVLMDSYPSRDAFGEDKYYDGLSTGGTGIEYSTGTGDVVFIGTHVMQGAGNGTALPRYDNIEVGGPVSIECFNNSNPAFFIGGDIDASTVQMYGSALRFSGTSYISGGRNRFPDDDGENNDKIITVDPRMRYYADGSNNPSGGIVEGIPGLSIGVFSRSGYSDFNGDYDNWNKINQPTASGYNGLLDFSVPFMAYNAAGRNDRGLDGSNCRLGIPTGATAGEAFIVVQDMDVLTNGSVVLRDAGGTVDFPLNRGDYVIITNTYSGGSNLWVDTDMVRTEYSDVKARDGAFTAQLSRPVYTMIPRDEDDLEEIHKPGGSLGYKYKVGGINYQWSFDGVDEVTHTIDNFRVEGDNIYLGSNTSLETGINVSSGNVNIKTDGTNWVEVNGSGRLAPTTDNAQNLGASGLRWGKLFAVDADFDGATEFNGPITNNNVLTARNDIRIGSTNSDSVLRINNGDTNVWSIRNQDSDNDFQVLGYSGQAKDVIFEWQGVGQGLRIEDSLNVFIPEGYLRVGGGLATGGGEEETISAGGAITPLYHFVRLLPNSGTSDTLTTINDTNATAGDRIILCNSSNTNTITISNSGNIKMSGSLTLDNIHDVAEFVYFGGNWRLVSFSNNA